MLFIVGGEIREVHFPPVIKDEQWSKIAELSGLPPEARPELDDYIGFYRELRLDAQAKYGPLWKEVRRARAMEVKSRETLKALISNENIFFALAIGLDGQEKIPAREVAIIRRWLTDSLEEKTKVLGWYDKALTRLH
jgi:hypothetical protein